MIISGWVAAWGTTQQAACQAVVYTRQWGACKVCLQGCMGPHKAPRQRVTLLLSPTGHQHPHRHLVHRQVKLRIRVRLYDRYQQGDRWIGLREIYWRITLSRGKMKVVSTDQTVYFKARSELITNWLFVTYNLTTRTDFLTRSRSKIITLDVAP